jgi:hypothetical protein
MDNSSTITQADRAAASGDFALAQKLLAEAATAPDADACLFLKLAAASKAAGHPRAALAAVERALAQDPLDFVALVLRATLLDALGAAEAAEAWSHALAQRPTASCRHP